MAKLKPGIGIGGLSGTSGSAVFVQRRDGSTILRERPMAARTSTPEQNQARDRLAAASRAWKSLSDAEQMAWQDWVRQTDPLAAVAGTANAFRGLATRFLLVNPDSEPPRLPPAAPFGGDGVFVQASAATGSILYAPDRPNTPGVVTELLLTPVRSALSEPRDRDFRQAALTTFDGGDPVAVSFLPGRYAVAIRFIRSASGQATPVMRLGQVRVE